MEDCACRLYRRIFGTGWGRGSGGVLFSVTALLCGLRGGREALAPANRAITLRYFGPMYSPAASARIRGPPSTGTERRLRFREHAAVTGGARVKAYEAHCIHQCMGRARDYRHLAGSLQRSQKIDRLQTAARNQQGVGSTGSRKHTGAEMEQLLLGDRVGGADQIQSLDDRYLKTALLQESLERGVHDIGIRSCHSHTVGARYS